MNDLLNGKTPKVVEVTEDEAKEIPVSSTPGIVCGPSQNAIMRKWIDQAISKKFEELDVGRRLEELYLQIDKVKIEQKQLTKELMEKRGENKELLKEIKRRYEWQERPFSKFFCEMCRYLFDPFAKLLNTTEKVMKLKNGLGEPTKNQKSLPFLQNVKLITSDSSSTISHRESTDPNPYNYIVGAIVTFFFCIILGVLRYKYFGAETSNAFWKWGPIQRITIKLK